MNLRNGGRVEYSVVIAGCSTISGYGIAVGGASCLVVLGRSEMLKITL